MKKILIPVAEVALAGLAWWWLRPAPAQEANVASTSETGEQASASPSAWIEVEHSAVMRTDEQGADLGPIASGDKIAPGERLKTDATGQATIHFGDGSSLRLDHDSVLQISQGEYDPSAGALKVQSRLVVGRLWSKVRALATPESYWQVRTATAVATVRGTAFGVSASTTGDSQFFGSEHKVGIALLDPETGAELNEATTTLGEHESLSVKSKDLQALKKLDLGTRHKKLLKLLAKQNWNDRSPLSAWLKANETKDKNLKLDVKEKSRTEEVKTSAPKHTGTLKAPAAITSLEIRLIKGALKLTEGETITFQALASYDDGTTKVVTDKASWRVVGSIGRLTSPGVFRAELGSDVSEIGTAFGAVTATIKSATGELVGKSEIITVTGAVDAGTSQG